MVLWGAFNRLKEEKNRWTKTAHDKIISFPLLLYAKQQKKNSLAVVRIPISRLLRKQRAGTRQKKFTATQHDFERFSLSHR